MKIADAIISNFDLSNYVRVVPDKPINHDCPIVSAPVLRLSPVLHPSDVQPNSTEPRQ